MIFDKIENWKVYFKHDIFKEIFKELEKINSNTPDGIHFKNENYYFKVISYSTKIDADIIENHRKEVDIQIILSGSEKIKLFSRESLEVIRAYSKEDDSQFYKSISKSNSEVILRPGYMGVYFNQDIHNPQYAVNSKVEKIKKVVIKINEEFFTQ